MADGQLHSSTEQVFGFIMSVRNEKWTYIAVCSERTYSNLTPGSLVEELYHKNDFVRNIARTTKNSNSVKHE